MVGVSMYIDYPDEGFREHAEDWKGPINVIENVVAAIFTLEIVIKAMSLKYRPLDFFLDKEKRAWNVFDLLIVILVMLPIVVPSLADAFQQLAVFRLLRLARLLKVFKSVVQLQVIIRGLVKGVYSVFYVSILVLLMLFIFGIIGAPAAWLKPA
eukprot:116909-Prymnesium_polylepis.2